MRTDPDDRLMLAWLSERCGGPETLALRRIPVPAPAPGEVRIKVIAAALNYPDALLIEDRYQLRIRRPFVPGSEMAGIVQAVGSDVKDFAPGDRVIGMAMGGGLAGYAVIESRKCFALPPHVGFETGAALMITYGTSLHALTDHGAIARGDRLLVLGAAGGIGLAAVQLGKYFGASVVAAVSSAEKAEAARAAGADDLILYPDALDAAECLQDFTAALKDVVGGTGAQLVLDPIGGRYSEPALRTLSWGGRYLIVGFPAGIPRLQANLLLLKSARACGVSWGEWAAREPAAFRRQIEQLLELCEVGKIAPRITASLPLERAPEGFKALSNRRAIGKILIASEPATDHP